jgi:hypothetical protein
MDAKEGGEELAARYLRGECNEVQLNYLAHQIGLTPDEMEKLIDRASYIGALERASILVISLIFFNFFSCFLYALFSFFF